MFSYGICGRASQQAHVFAAPNEAVEPKAGATKLKIRQPGFGRHVFLAPLPDLSAYCNALKAADDDDFQ
ncbi:hypothetical protein [Aestuariivirga sp.]|uniref:hypothetical protein n=1 Tax=Aestuariivirga sp. TaxID=2650926 RepID=UPI003BA92FC1